MNGNESLTFLPTTPTMLFGIVAVIATAVLSFINWRRSGFARGTGLLETLRLLLVILVAVTLNQPEWRQEVRPEQKPLLAVLWDDSHSMDTHDVIDPQRPTDPPKTRAECVKPFLEEAIWKPISTRMDVVFEPFSSTLPEPREGSDLNEALSRMLAQHETLRGMVLLSDGGWNEGLPPVRAATQLRMEGIPVFSVPVGSDTRLPDVELVAFDAPTFGVIRKPLRIPFTVESALPRDYDVLVSLTSSTGEEVTKHVRVPAMGRLQDTITWRPTTPGDYTLTMRVPQAPDEIIADNNEMEVPVAIRDESLQVLLIESVPRWEYRYLRNALERDPGVDVTCLLFHPGLSKVGGGRGYIKTFPDSQDLTKYDVIFLGDVGVGDKQLTDDQCKNISRMVRSQAAGLVFMPGSSGRQLTLLSTELGKLYPVVVNAAQPTGWGARLPGQFELTKIGQRSLLTKLEESDEANAERWEKLPGFQWYAAVIRAKAGTEVLAVHRTERTTDGRVPLIATKTYGTGKILFMGTDGAWRWREGVEDKYHYRFWGQVARWMAYQRNMAQDKSMRLFYSPDRPQTDNVLTLNANAISLGGDPLLEGTVVAQIVSPSGKTDSVRLNPGGKDSWGLFTGTFTPQEHGTYEVTMTCRENGAVLETTFDVQGTSREKLGQPARFDVLKEISAVSRGKMTSLEEVQDLLDELAELPEPEPIVRRLRIWCHPLWAGMIVVLMGVFWIGRKMIGAI